MRLIALLEYAAVVIGVLAMIAGQFFALPKGFPLGIFLVGAGMVVGGMEAILTRRMAFRPSDDAYENYAGAPAMIVGLMALAAAGLFLIGIGVLMTLNPQGRHGRVWRVLIYAPRSAVGVLMIAAGMAVTGLGAWEWLEPNAFDVFVTKLPRSPDLLF